MQGVAFDTMLESYVLDSSANARGYGIFGLKYLGLRLISFEDIAGKGVSN